MPTVDADRDYFDPRGRIGRFNVLLSCTVVLIFLLLWGLHEKVTHHTSEEDPLCRPPKRLPADSYIFCVLTLLRDVQMIVLKRGNVNLRASRIVASFVLLFGKISIQLLVITCIKAYVTAKWVHDLRVDYDEYERDMYPGHTVLTSTGHRGTDGNLRIEQFDLMSDDLKERVCAIPFSQQGFFMAILFIWTLTCISEIRSSIEMLNNLILQTKVIPSMSGCLSNVGKEDDEDMDGTASAQVMIKGTHLDEDMIIMGITRPIKTILTVVVILPRLIVPLIMLWLGSRFLAATNDFSELVLNAVGLEFIMKLKDLLYYTIVPARCKREISRLTLVPAVTAEAATYYTYLGSFKWAFISFVWCAYYTYYLQQVLPNYRWDVQRPCSEWITRRYQIYGHVH